MTPSAFAAAIGATLVEDTAGPPWEDFDLVLWVADDGVYLLVPSSGRRVYLGRTLSPATLRRAQRSLP